MTQAEIAKKLNIARPYLNAILSGKKIPGRKLARKISKELGISFWTLRPNDKELAKEYIKAISES